MFVEQLSKEDFIDYLTKYELVRYDEYTKSQYDFNAITDYKVCEGKVTFRINDKKFKFTDYYFRTNYIIVLRRDAHDKNWLNFMFKKFGNPYKFAFLKFRELEKSRVLDETGAIFDNDTLNYVEGFNSDNTKSNSDSSDEKI